MPFLEPVIEAPRQYYALALILRHLSQLFRNRNSNCSPPDISMSNQRPSTSKKGQTIKRAGARYAETLQKYASQPVGHEQSVSASSKPLTVPSGEVEAEVKTATEAEAEDEHPIRKRKRPHPVLPPIGEAQPGPSNQATNPPPSVAHSATRDSGPAAVFQAAVVQGDTPSETTAQTHTVQGIRDATRQFRETEDSEMIDNEGDQSEGERASQSKQGKEPESVNEMMKRIEDIHNDEGGKVAVEALITLLQKVMDLKSADNEKDKQANSRKKPTVPNPANDPSIPWEQDKPHNIAPVVKHREVERNALLGYIRFLVYSFLGRQGPSDPLPPAPPETEILAPTAKAFFIRWYESELSLFNQTAARIVADQVLADMPGIKSFMTLDEIQELVTAHIIYLKACWTRQNDPNCESKEARRLRRCSADTRKRTLYSHRVAVLETIPGLERHTRLIAALGIDGTSSDEEDPKTKGVYIIHCRVPLSEQVTHLKRQLDQVYAVHFKGPGSRGNPARIRVDRGLKSKRPFLIKGLPDTCFDPGSLMLLTPLQQQMLEMRRLDYDFSFPNELLEAPSY
ncbi:hypothetical protein FRC11_008346 [Ceratobasidium sp. 423]|nr:hypothetical protein FRC11_008346 [Ceratobasidium sp. 423]